MAITITKPTIGGSEDTWGLTINNALDDVVDALNGTAGTVAPDHTVLTINGTDVTSTAAELNVLDGVVATTAELNILSGVVASTAEINYLDGVTSPIQTQINSIIAGESGGTVTSVGLSVPTGFAVSGSPVTTSGTLGLSFASGYSLLTSAQATSISNIPTATSQLTNDSGFITSQYTQPTTLGDVGTYALMQNHSGSSVSAGGTVSGSSLKYHNINFSETGTPAASGNWRVMGRFAGSGTGTTNAISVCLRIA
jgi:hypothetical protein